MADSVSRDQLAIRNQAATPVYVVLFVLGLVALIAMSVAAHSLAYFPGDLTISHAVQAHSSDWLDVVLGAVSWLGFPPQSDILFGIVVAILLVLGARWAAVTQTIAAVGAGGLYFLVEHFVGHPRPSADLVRVAGPIQMTGFPSGHLATFTAVFGFLAFLCYRWLAPSRMRFLPIVVVAVVLAILGFARIYSGQHWASDVVAGCLLGGLWLAVVIAIYSWGESMVFRFGGSRRHTLRQAARPVSPD